VALQSRAIAKMLETEDGARKRGRKIRQGLRPEPWRAASTGWKGVPATHFSMTAASFWLWVWVKRRKKISLRDHEVGCFDSSVWGYFSGFLAKATGA